MPNDTTPQKTCTKCGQSFPATAEYFYAHKEGEYGLRPDCKTCAREYNRAYRQANRDAIAEYKREYYQVNQDKKREYDREYYRANQDEKREYQHEYRQANPEYIHKYRQVYKARRRKRDREHYRANPEQYRISKSRRAARKRSLPATLTTADWLTCLEYFNYRCAVCEKQMRDLFGEINIHQDHWIPLVSETCPGTTVDNIVCLCSECNLSKNAKHPEQWLMEKFDKRKAAQILERVQTYFEWTQLPK